MLWVNKAALRHDLDSRDPARSLMGILTTETESRDGDNYALSLANVKHFCSLREDEVQRRYAFETKVSGTVSIWLVAVRINCSNYHVNTYTRCS